MANVKKTVPLPDHLRLACGRGWRDLEVRPQQKCLGHEKPSSLEHVSSSRLNTTYHWLPGATNLDPRIGQPYLAAADHALYVVKCDLRMH